MNEINFSQLKKKAKELSLKERARSSCLKFLKNESPLPNNCEPEKIDMEFMSLSLVFDNSFLLAPYFETKLLLFYGGAEIGTYKLITSPEGEDLDDYLVFNQ